MLESIAAVLIDVLFILLVYGGWTILRILPGPIWYRALHCIRASSAVFRGIRMNSRRLNIYFGRQTERCMR